MEISKRIKKGRNEKKKGKRREEERSVKSVNVTSRTRVAGWRKKINKKYRKTTDI